MKEDCAGTKRKGAQHASLDGRRQRIVIVGGGFAGLYAYLELHKKFHGVPGAPEVVVVSAQNYFLFTPLLHEVATGSVNPVHIIQPVRQVVDRCLKEFVVDRVTEVDLSARDVTTEGGKRIKYDYLLLATGSTTALRGFSQDSLFTLKDMNDARTLKNRMVDMFEKANAEDDADERRRLLTFVVVGGGPTGVELVTEIKEFVRDTLLHLYGHVHEDDVRVVLVESGKDLVPHFRPRLREKTQRVLEGKGGIEIMFNTKAEKITKEEVVLVGGERIPAATTVLAAGIEVVSPKFSPGVEPGPKGRIPVDEFLRLPSDHRVFLAGDMAAARSEEGLIPQTAQAAVQEGQTAGMNILATIEGRPLSPFVYKEKGQLLSLGRWMAVAEISRFAFFGHFAWWLWRTIYVLKLIGWGNRLRVMLDWTIGIFYPRDTSRI